jgi:hypothetical protein
MRRKQSRMIFETSESMGQATNAHYETLRHNLYEQQLSQYDYQVVPSQSKQATFQCNMLDIHFDTPGVDNQTPGYYIRLESIQDKQVYNITKVNKIHNMQMMKQGAF